MAGKMRHVVAWRREVRFLVAADVGGREISLDRIFDAQPNAISDRR